MLKLEDFDKAEGTPTGARDRVIVLTPKKPVPGLNDLAITLFATRWKRNEYVIWGWEWTASDGWRDSSVAKDAHFDDPKLGQEHFNIESAAQAAIKSACFQSDEERLPREERSRQEQEAQRARLDNQVRRFLES